MFKIFFCGLFALSAGLLGGCCYHHSHHYDECSPRGGYYSRGAVYVHPHYEHAGYRRYDDCR